MSIHPKILKAARLVLKISQDEVAEAAGITRRTLTRLETQSPDASFRSIGAVRKALEGYGVVFIEDGDKCGFKLSRSLLDSVAGLDP
jgi:transcriptional regulator with XRE-family HTH domain